MKIDFQQIAAKEDAIIKLLIDNGAYPYLVGGTVRDLILYNKIKKLDFDVEVYNLTLTELVAIFETAKINYDLQGNFGVIKIYGCNLEIAIPRRENKIGQSHSDFEINLDPFMKPSEAIMRRDFTINTLMYDFVKNQLVENKRAMQDIKKRELVHVSNKFSEDPLRILRAIRFSVCHNLVINDDTLKICLQIIEQLKYISIERIDAELSKILTASYLNNKKEYLNIFLVDFLKLNIDVNKIQFSDNLQINYALIIMNLKEQKEMDLLLKYVLNKKMRKQIKYLVENNNVKLLDVKILYDHLSNDDFLESLIMFQLFLNKISSFERNLILENILIINNLKKKYNGHYFLKKGIDPKEIRHKQKSFILTKMITCEI